MTTEEQKRFDDGVQLGIAAFAAGRRSAPLGDPAVIEYISKNNPGVLGWSIPFLNGWAAGWHQANLEKPLTSLLQ